MSIFSDSFRVVAWFVLCVAMAIGMVIFAIFYGLFTYLLRKTAWKHAPFTMPSFKIAK